MWERTIEWQPRHLCMAGLAVLTGYRVHRWFIGGTASAIVTTTACTGLARKRPVIKLHIQPTPCTPVASIAGRCSLEMIGILTHGTNPIVAIGAGIRGLIVRKWLDQGQPLETGMTALALIRSKRVATRLAGGLHTVMACGT